ncbi:MAG: tRNA (adenosine(37)-N6)-threonylcarbamoyltransferase complex dimerization subunit type 1 TsaB [Alcanivoracaceae bacterium]|nr:tRNA (adenosine(37)-N6)-threonylcarbamoyltransferase complex dimerization subunit type 1 TsaB [Alcanivoracaceae bacterium]
MILLAIDTATECCSAALWVDGKLYHRSTVQPRLHAELILPFIDELLTEAGIQKKDIQGLVVGQGPGAFTGVRIGVGVAQGLALALNIKVIAISNLKTLAYTAYQQLQTDKRQIIVVATDARMSEVYSATYSVKGSTITAITNESVGKAKHVDLSASDAYIGSGFAVYPELIAYAKRQPMDYDVNVYSQAKDMLLLAKDGFKQLATHIDMIEPIYLREP